MTDFQKYYDAGFGGEVLPVLPPDAPLSTASTVSEGMRGKVPGSFNTRTGRWSGIWDWAALVFGPDRPPIWGVWPGASVGMRASKYPGADLDCSEMLVVDFAIDHIFEKLGPAPIRGRAGSSRCLLIYRLADGETPPRKIRIAFHLPGDADDAPPHAFELLCSGQQYLIEGRHKSGALYEYEGGVDLEVVTSAGLTAVTAADWEALRTSLSELLKSLGATIVSVSGQGTASEADKKAIGDESLMTADLGELARALNAIPDEELDYDAWVNVLRAAKAASGGDEFFYAEVVVPWSARKPDNTEEMTRGRWNSFSDSVLGADWLYGVAREHGFVGGVSEFDAVPETPEEATERTKKDELYERFVYVFRSGNYYDKQQRLSMDSKGLCHLLPELGLVNHTSKNAHWMMQREAGQRTQTVFGLTYAPGKPEILTLDGLTRANTWRDTGLRPLDGDASLWLRHMELMIPDARAREIVLDWLALIYQRQDLKPNWHLLFWSAVQGVGKNLMLFPLEKGFGTDNVSSPTTATLSGGFTPYYGTRFVIGDEIECSGRAGTKIYEKLKVALAGSITVEINLKNEKQVMAKNTTAWVFLSNKPDALRLEAGDRRVMVNHIAMTQEEHDRLRDEGYYKRLADWLGVDEEGDACLGARVVLGYLLKRDVSAFDYGGEAPSTAAKIEMTKSALPECVQYILDLRDEGAPFLQGDLLVLREVINRLQGLGQHSFRGEFTDKAVARALTEMGFVLLEHQRRIDGTKKRLWARGDIRHYAAMSAKDLAAAYAQQRGEDGRLDGLTVVS